MLGQDFVDSFLIESEIDVIWSNKNSTKLVCHQFHDYLCKHVTSRLRVTYVQGIQRLQPVAAAPAGRRARRSSRDRAGWACVAWTVCHCSQTASTPVRGAARSGGCRCASIRSPTGKRKETKWIVCGLRAFLQSTPEPYLYKFTPINSAI